MASIDANTRPGHRCVRDSALAGWVGPNIHAVGWARHESAPGSRVVNFVVAIGLSVLIDDEAWHSVRPPAIALEGS